MSKSLSQHAVEKLTTSWQITPTTSEVSLKNEILINIKII